MLPVSAISMSCFIDTGYRARAATISPESTRRLSSPRPRMPPTKSMRFDERRSVMSRMSRRIMSDERIPAAVEVKREIVQAVGAVYFSAFVLDDEILFETGEEFGGSETVEILYHTVVIDDFKVRRGESDSKEIVVFLVAAMFGIVCRLFVSDKSGGGCAVMAVGNVKCRHGLEGSRDAVVERGVDQPESVAETVGGYKIIFRLGGCDGAYHLLEVVIVGESEEHRLDIGIVATDVLHAVFFLVAACKLVFFDSA